MVRRVIVALAASSLGLPIVGGLWLSSPVGAVSYPHGVDTNKIVFVSDNTGTFGLVDADGTNPSSVQAYSPESDEIVMDPSLLPDGSTILFSKEPGGALVGCQVSVGTINTDGSGLSAVPNRLLPLLCAVRVRHGLLIAVALQYR